MNLILAGLLALVSAQDDGNAFGLADQKRVDTAIAKGVAYLRKAAPEGWHRSPHCKELILLTLIHADVAPSDPTLQKYLKDALSAKLQRTYTVALQAMSLEALDRATYQGRIAQCIQFIVDNQCPNGQWSYGEETVTADDSVATGGGLGLDRPSTATSAIGARSGPKPRGKIYIRRKGQGPASGDNSNSQYAALGLRAGYDANVRVSNSVLALARKWWIDSQHSGADKGDRPAIATGVNTGVPRGWSYKGKDTVREYGSMTAGAVSALIIYDHMLGRKWERDQTVRDGMAWLAKHFTVTENPGPCQIYGHPNAFEGYYLYALERVGMLYGTVRIGSHFWYLDGAEQLLKSQRDDGSWNMSRVRKNVKDKKADVPVWDTCFAILFLKRATRPLVASTDQGGR